MRKKSKIDSVNVKGFNKKSNIFFTLLMIIVAIACVFPFVFVIIISKFLSLKSGIFLNKMFSVEFSMETFSLLPFRISLQLHLKLKNALKNYRS